jgi:hypothetical protein
VSEIERYLRETDPEILAAADEVDGGLIEWALGMSPLERARACSRATAALAKWADATPGNR